MAVSLVLHRVADYDAWRKVYDSYMDGHKESGVTQASVQRMAEDPDNVLVILHFDSLDNARAFFDRPDLKDAMQHGGVQGGPRIEFFD